MSALLYPESFTPDLCKLHGAIHGMLSETNQHAPLCSVRLKLHTLPLRTVSVARTCQIRTRHDMLATTRLAFLHLCYIPQVLTLCIQFSYRPDRVTPQMCLTFLCSISNCELVSRIQSCCRFALAVDNIFYPLDPRCTHDTVW